MTKTVHKARKKKPSLLWSFTIMCSGHRHVVGVTKRGALYLPGHTMKTLERELQFHGLGGQSCKCAEILEGWRKGSFKLEVPPYFALERLPDKPPCATAARRLQRQLARRRGDPVYVGRPLQTEQDSYPDAALAGQIAAELRRRGLKVKHDGPRLRLADLPEPEQYRLDPYELHVRTHPHGYLYVTIGNTAAKLGTVPAALFNRPPVRSLADLLERRRLAYFLKTNHDALVAKNQEVFKRYNEELRQAFPAKNTRVNVNTASGLFTLKFEFERLTFQAARKMLQVYEQVRGPLVRFKNANAQRHDNPNRCPSPPGGKEHS